MRFLAIFQIIEMYPKPQGNLYCKYIDWYTSVLNEAR